MMSLVDCLCLSVRLWYVTTTYLVLYWAWAPHLHFGYHTDCVLFLPYREGTHQQLISYLGIGNTTFWVRFQMEASHIFIGTLMAVNL